MILVELTIFVLVPFLRIGLDFFRPLDEFLMLDLHEHLGNGSVKREQYQLKVARWSTKTPVVGSSPQILVWPLVPHLVPVVRSPSVRFLPLVIPSSPSSFSLG